MYPKALGLTYIDTLLKAASTQFNDLYSERILRKSSIPQFKDWDVQFEALLQTIEDQDSLVRTFLLLRASPHTPGLRPSDCE